MSFGVQVKRAERTVHCGSYWIDELGVGGGNSLKCLVEESATRTPNLKTKHLIVHSLFQAWAKNRYTTSDLKIITGLQNMTAAKPEMASISADIWEGLQIFQC